MPENDIEILARNTVKNCPYKAVTAGIDICTLDVLPCERVIDIGKCQTLIELFHTFKTKIEEEA